MPVDTITHPFELWSAYAPLHGRHVIEEVSTYHADHGNPDFIFYSVRSKEFGSDVSLSAYFFNFLMLTKSSENLVVFLVEFPR